MLQSHIIEVNGASVGVAVRTDQGYRFVATDFRLEEQDGSVWGSLDEVRRIARRTLQAAMSDRFFDKVFADVLS
jgi:hypothetical protein